MKNSLDGSGKLWRVGREISESEAQHPATLAADSKTGADRSDAAALQKKSVVTPTF